MAVYSGWLFVARICIRTQSIPRFERDRGLIGIDVRAWAKARELTAQLRVGVYVAAAIMKFCDEIIDVKLIQTSCPMLPAVVARHAALNDAWMKTRFRFVFNETAVIAVGDATPLRAEI